MEAPIAPHYSVQQLHEPNLFQSPHSGLVQQQELGIEAFHFDPQLENQPDLSLQGRHPFESGSFDSRAHQQPRFHEIRPGPSLSVSPNGPFVQDTRYATPQEVRQKDVEIGGGQQMFGVLTPHPQLSSQPQSHSEALGRLQHEIDLRPQPIVDVGTTDGHFSNMKLIPNPPDLDEWRQRLFDVDDIITMTEDEYVSLSA